MIRIYCIYRIVSGYDTFRIRLEKYPIGQKVFQSLNTTLALSEYYLDISGKSDTGYDTILFLDTIYNTALRENHKKKLDYQVKQIAN